MRIFVGLLLAAVAGVAAADHQGAHGQAMVESITLQCNWGQVTVTAIKESNGKALGEHSSSQPTPRVGLANVIEQGNLEATCEFLAGEPLPCDPEVC